MKRYVSWNSAWSSASRLMICAWMLTSSAETASSAAMNSGCTARARAIPARWRWPPRELVRVAVERIARQPDDLDQLLCAPRRRAAARDPVDAQRLGQHRADRHPRVQRRVRVLEDHLHPAAHLAQRIPLQGGHVHPVELDPTVRGVHQPDHGSSERRLAAAGLPHQPERLAALDVERDAVHGAHGADLSLEDDPLGDREVDLQPFGAQERDGSRFRLRSRARKSRVRPRRRSRGALRLEPGRNERLALGRIPARHLVPVGRVGCLLERRHLLPAAILDVEAARGERAARRSRARGPAAVPGSARALRGRARRDAGSIGAGRRCTGGAAGRRAHRSRRARRCGRRT